MANEKKITTTWTHNKHRGRLRVGQFFLDLPERLRDDPVAREFVEHLEYRVGIAVREVYRNLSLWATFEDVHAILIEDLEGNEYPLPTDEEVEAREKDSRERLAKTVEDAIEKAGHGKTGDALARLKESLEKLKAKGGPGDASH